MRIRANFLAVVVGCSLLTSLCSVAQHALVPEKAFFLSGNVLRRGCLYKPPGDGPFPVMVYNQATSKPAPEFGDTVPFAGLARLYTDKGYVLFLPGRRTADESEQKAIDAIEDQNKRFMAALDIHNRDIEAAIIWLKAQAFVDEKRVFISGHSSGAIQSLMLARKDLGVLGIVAFSPGSKIWNENPLLRDELASAVKEAKVPIFLIQPQNDFSLGPSHLLSQELAKKGSPNRSKVFLPQGGTAVEGNAFAFSTPEIWRDDVFSFLQELLRKQVQ